MKVVQLIDSLNAGGAERIAVNYANSLVEHCSFSGLIASRKEGDLIRQLNSSVDYLFLNRKKILDFKAIKLFSRYIKNNHIEIIHAHGSSFFLASLMKLNFPYLKILYHEHNGQRLRYKWYNNFSLIFCSLLFERVLTVNKEIQTWSTKNLFCKKVDYIPNFAILKQHEVKETFLKGEKTKKIICLANLRHPKNHFFLLKVFSEIKNKDWTLHFIGKDYNDVYSKNLKEFILINNLEEDVFIYDSRQDINHILSQSEIGILSSTYEGFPVSILEYGLSNLAVISTNVGYCKEIITNEETGLLFDPFDENQLKTKLDQMISSETLRTKLAKNLHHKVKENYSEDKVINTLLRYYKS